jgi:hypothetical protein
VMAFVRLSDKKIRLRSQIYMGRVSICPAWKEESFTIDAYVCYLLITYKTAMQPNRMRNRNAQAFCLSGGLVTSEAGVRVYGGRVGYMHCGVSGVGE